MIMMIMMIMMKVLTNVKFDKKITID
jgi:hypothetical protein